MRLCGIMVLLGLVLPAMALARDGRDESLEGTASVTLYWTTPGDDGRWGTAKRYDLRYSQEMIRESNFHQATPVRFVPFPGLGGSLTHVTVNGLTPNVGYYFALKTADEKDNWSALSNVVYWDGRTTGVSGPGAQAQLSLPFPNPARGSTRFSLTLSQAQDVRIELYDISGRRVHVLTNGVADPGITEYVWNFRDDLGRKLDPGVYLARAQIGRASFTRRIVAIE